VTELPPDVVAIGVGGNIGGEPAIVDRFRRARDAFAQLGAVRAAPLYRTAPLGPPQPAYLNTALRVRIGEATPDQLIATVLELERGLGRDRQGEARNGPRAIDLDVLLWGTRTIGHDTLVVPHPRLAERRFVIAPLVELFGGDLIVPGSRITLAELARAVAEQVVEQIATTW
jgi:2-amino-4-hydroxy-6-hydroxymethyldihydropteridine diphosphokinase